MKLRSVLISSVFIISFVICLYFFNLHIFIGLCLALFTFFLYLKLKVMVKQDSELRNRDIIKANPDMIFIFAEDGRILDYDAKNQEELYEDSKIFLGKNVSDILPKDIAELTLKNIKLVKETGKLQICDYMLDIGKIQYFESRMVSYGDNKYLSIIRNITVSKLMEKTMAEEEELLRMTLLSIGEGVISTNNQGKIHLFNKVAEQLTGFHKGEAVGKPIEEIFNVINESSRVKYDNYLENVLKNENIILISKDGTEIPIENSMTYIYDDQGNTNGVVIVFRDFTEKKDRQRQIEYLSYHDQLTGLHNRRYLEQEFMKLDLEENLPITIVMADVNGLKLINDSFGHRIGDNLLKKVAEAINKIRRDNDIIARLGGDEFIILLPKTDEIEAERIVEDISETLLNEKIGAAPITVSFGYETKNHFNEKIMEIYKKAEDICTRKNFLKVQLLEVKLYLLL